MRILVKRPRITLDPATVNIVFSGNSIGAGTRDAAGTNWVNAVFGAAAPWNGAWSFNNTSVSGHTTTQWIADHSAIDSNWHSGKRNILVFVEIINDIWVNAISGAQAATNLGTLNTAINGQHPWEMIVVAGTPRFQGPVYTGAPFTPLQTNNAIKACNALLRDGGHRNYGLAGFADIQTGPFDPADTEVEANYPLDYYDNGDGSDAHGTVLVHYTHKTFAEVLTPAITATIRRLAKQ